MIVGGLFWGATVGTDVRRNFGSNRRSKEKLVVAGVFASALSAMAMSRRQINTKQQPPPAYIVARGIASTLGEKIRACVL